MAVRVPEGKQPGAAKAPRAGDWARLNAIIMLVMLSVLVACGRFGFEPRDADATPTELDAGDYSRPHPAPALPRWRSLALPYAAGAAASAVLGDGLHYLGGSSSYFGTTRYQHHYVYETATDSWSASPADVPDSDTWGARAHVYGGKLYLLGGYPGGNRLRVYDPLTNAWTQLKAPPVNLLWGFASGVIGDALFAFGGEPLAASNAAGYRYDFATNAWTQVASIPQNAGRGALSSAVVGARLYVLNGNQDDGTSVLQIYDSPSDTWSFGARLEGHLFEAAAAVAVDSKVYFLGGAADQDLVDSSSARATLTNRVNVYDTTTDSWSAGAPMAGPKMWATCVVYEGDAHVLGGLDASSSELGDHEVLGL